MKKQIAFIGITEAVVLEISESKLFMILDLIKHSQILTEPLTLILRICCSSIADRIYGESWRSTKMPLMTII
jgi:hypothetical protein